jgi:hypothetical protein
VTVAWAVAAAVIAAASFVMGLAGFGIALIALGVACWPTGMVVQTNSPPFRAMLVYNALIALFLAYLFVAGPFAGALLWPAVAVHALVALLMAWTWIVEQRTPRNL